MVEGSSDDALEVLQTVIENLLDAVRNDATKFRNSVAPLTGAISLLLHRECEEYGMTKELYSNVMKFNRKNPQKFRAIMEMGHFEFEGTNYDTNKQIVLYVGDSKLKGQSSIPPSFLSSKPSVGVGQKRKLIPRGPGRGDFKSPKSSLLSSQQISKPMIEMIESVYANYSVNKKNEIVVAIISTLMKKYSIKYEDLNSRKYSDSNDRIVFSLQSYLKNLQKFGAKFGSSEFTIDKILTATVVYCISDVEMSKMMGVTRKRVASAKQRRGTFDDIATKAEKDNESCNSDSSDESYEQFS